MSVSATLSTLVSSVESLSDTVATKDDIYGLHHQLGVIQELLQTRLSVQDPASDALAFSFPGFSSDRNSRAVSLAGEIDQTGEIFGTDDSLPWSDCLHELTRENSSGIPSESSVDIDQSPRSTGDTPSSDLDTDRLSNRCIQMQLDNRNDVVEDSGMHNTDIDDTRGSRNEITTAIAANELGLRVICDIVHNADTLSSRTPNIFRHMCRVVFSDATCRIFTDKLFQRRPDHVLLCCCVAVFFLLGWWVSVQHLPVPPMPVDYGFDFPTKECTVNAKYFSTYQDY